jgi:hypothetical protein
MVTKRGPGAGRPSKGDIKGKTSTFATRITAETRHALEMAAKKNRRSLSQQAEVVLKAGLRDEKPGGKPRNHAVAEMVLYLAEGIERATGENWRKDVFTSMALRYAVEAVLFHFAPGTEENPTVPPAVEGWAEKMPPEYAERYRRPADLGHMRADSLISEIVAAAPSGKMLDEWDLPIGLNASLKRFSLLAADLDRE